MDTPIRILHVFGQLNRGGSETLIMNQYRNLDRSKVQYDFVVHGNKEGVYEKEIKLLGGKIYRVPRYRIWNHYEYKKQWEKLLTTINNVKILHSHVRSTASIFMSIAKNLNYQTIIHSHNTQTEKNIKGFISFVLQKNITKDADFLFACGIDAGEWLYGKNAKFTVIPNAIDTEKFTFEGKKRKSIRKKLQFNDDIIFGHIGRFHSQKNHDFLIDVFKDLIKSNKKIKLLLIGEGELEPDIKKKVQKLKLEKNIIFLGRRSDIPNLMHAMDYFILPSKYEGLPVVLVEAQSLGLKSFVSNKITKEVNLSNKINYIDLNKNSNEWAEIISKELNEKNVNRKMGAKIVQEKGYDVKKLTKELEKMYKEIYIKG